VEGGVCEETVWEVGGGDEGGAVLIAGVVSGLGTRAGRRGEGEEGGRRSEGGNWWRLHVGAVGGRERGMGDSKEMRVRGSDLFVP
jgi:hypothetical protein